MSPLRAGVLTGSVLAFVCCFLVVAGVPAEVGLTALIATVIATPVTLVGAYLALRAPRPVDGWDEL